MPRENGLSRLTFTSEHPDFYYSVLNVPKSASQNEIRERYRALSVIFHPDKQHDERTKNTASKKFLDIQKAYEILSDPFLREVYDILGEDGLKLDWPVELRSKSKDEIQDTLKHTKRSITRHNLENTIRPRGSLTCGIDASSLSVDEGDRKDKKLVQKIVRRIKEVQISSLIVRHSIRKEFGEKTKLALSSSIASDEVIGVGVISAGNILGTIAHQYSPRIGLEATTALLRPQTLNLKTTYRDDNKNTAFFIQCHISPFMPRFPPPFTASWSRRLSRNGFTEGNITVHTGPRPRVLFNITSPTAFNFTMDRHIKRSQLSQTAGSVSGFAVGTQEWTYGATLDGLNSSLSAGIAYTFTELALQAKLGIEWGLTGLALMLTGTWQNESSEVAASVGLNPQGVLMKLDLSYLQQRFSVPIMLSHDYDAALALFTAVIPSTAFVLGYHYYLRPRRRAQRAAFLRAARRILDDDMSVIRRETEETLSLLKDTAQKHMQAESTKGGLVIVEASYGPSEQDSGTKDLVMDVTIALQALVHNSQVYIAGHRTKSGIQGFYDPTPSLSKSLRVRYVFRGRMHYAEIPDCVPVVLPLEDHLVS
ncbi:hypothetical protein PILCRDRAFT_5383 [Piloderma croceum F 1598]|uniref:J domain-containing protein n=1 Tax=Piloderma croceum (strain F 1598) TaxID=765440 RepID=A0A0C3G517_PILCF|nr:hypothetical protein PILCRDRAFT_5383 [Piloderma croceum F 1598]